VPLSSAEMFVSQFTADFLCRSVKVFEKFFLNAKNILLQIPFREILLYDSILNIIKLSTAE